MNNMNNYSRRAKAAAAFLGTGLALVVCYNACSNSGLGVGSIQNLTGTQSVGQQQVKMSVSVKDSSGATIYTDANSSSTLKVTSGGVYSVVINAVGSAPPGASLTLTLQNIDILNAPVTTLSVSYGSNQLPNLQPGDYKMVISEAAPNMVTVAQSYTANVVCANPSFSKTTGTTISVTQGSGQNVYNFSVSAAGDGQAPYLCALDPTGVGIIDTAFQPCGSAFNGIYNNYVAGRNVTVMIKDACNIAVPATVAINFPWAEPAMGGGINFIEGLTGSSPANTSGVVTGPAVGDLRDQNVQYLATNNGGNNIVQTQYSTGSFQITSDQNYGMNSSVPFGISISLTGITGNLGAPSGWPSLPANTLGVAAAKISSFSYSTDQAGDAEPGQVFSGTNCTLSNQGIKIVPTSGTPCTSGTATGNSVTVEMWGHYVCKGLASVGGATMDISGDFDGLNTLVDSCVGGQGQGGGIPPIEL